MPKQTFFNLPEKKRNHIIDVAMEEFSKAPYQNISINHLIKSMNIPTGSFYQYFEDKKDLYFYILSFYSDAELEEAAEKDRKMDLFEINQDVPLELMYPEARKKVKYYQEVFFDHFAEAPTEIKRDWTFDHLIGSKYMGLYDYSFFDKEQLDPVIKENKELFVGVSLAFTNVIHRFSSDLGEEWKLYRLCIDVLKEGLLHYKSDKTEK
ncbi:MAG: TetR/AcrR family transcriptional regulator [Negativibacillus sp.]